MVPPVRIFNRRDLQYVKSSAFSTPAICIPQTAVCRAMSGVLFSRLKCASKKCFVPSSKAGSRSAARGV